ncbi:MAG TPA: adenine phosphoribosyltransferase [Sphingobacteriaceae bacterium]
MITEKLKQVIRDIPDFPSPGILFKDITPILKDPDLCNQVVDALVQHLNGMKVDVVTGVESRGFLFGVMLANRLRVPFVPVRKKGKLPYATVTQDYDLEYGSATIEMHQDAFPAGSKVLIHDDLLATGGTVEAVSKLVQQLGGEVAAYSFIISLDFLKGEERLKKYSKNIIRLVGY